MRLGNKGFGRIFGLNSATRASKSSKYFQVLSGKKLWRIFLQRTSNQPRYASGWYSLYNRDSYFYKFSLGTTVASFL